MAAPFFEAARYRVCASRRACIRSRSFHKDPRGFALTKSQKRISNTDHKRVAQRREMGVVLADALADLPADHREVIVLRNLQDLAWPELGRRMGRSEEAVRKLWTRALVHLKPLIEKRL